MKGFLRRTAAFDVTSTPPARDMTLSLFIEGICGACIRSPSRPLPKENTPDATVTAPTPNGVHSIISVEALKLDDLRHLGDHALPEPATCL